MAIAPIWKDYFVNLGSSDSISFRIKVGDSQGEVIYSGRSHKRPGQEDNVIRINDICADFLHNTLPTLSMIEFSALSFPLSFVVEAYLEDDEEWDEADVVQFTNDWSYDDSFNPETMGLSFPVNGRIDARQFLVYTAYNASMITATITFQDGTSIPVYLPVEISADFNADFNLDFARSVRAASSGTAVFDLSEYAEYGDVASVTIDGRTWEVVTDCGKWALYYVNAFGGWDSLLIEGHVSFRDELTRHTRELEYDNRNVSSRGTHNFLNELTRVFTLHTSWMSDEESSRMHHLLNSTEVYLCDINQGQMLPVVLNNTTTDYKTYKGNGGRLVNYTIEATLAQDRIRR